MKSNGYGYEHAQQVTEADGLAQGDQAGEALPRTVKTYCYWLPLSLCAGQRIRWRTWPSGMNRPGRGHATATYPARRDGAPCGSPRRILIMSLSWRSRSP